MKRPGQILLSLCLTALTLALSANSQVSDAEGGDFVFEADLPGGRYYGANRRHFAEVEQGIALAQSRAVELFGAAAVDSFTVYLIDHPDQLRGFVGAGFPDWGAAAAQPDLRRIIIKAPELTTADKPLALLAAHEYAHLLVGALADGSAPRWLDEGLAMYLSSEWTFSDFTAISLASLRGAFIPLPEIERLNSFDEGAAHIAYAQSYLAVRYLVEYYGPEALGDALALLGEGRSADEALQQTIGIGLAGFEAELFAYIRERHTLVGVLMGSTIFWLALAALVVIGAALARKRKAARYRKWDEEERLQSTDFDYGDPDNPEKIEDEDRPWE